MREVVNENRMPPWHANPDHGEFSNNASLTADEKKLINKWVENGAPQGDPADLPEPQTFADGWRIGEPDFVVAMDETPFQVPATGVIEYKYFVVDPKFTEDKFIKAAEIRIGNRAVVHHVIVALDDEHNGPHRSVNSEWLTACAPGSPPLELPDGFAKVIPAGSKLVFQVHYTPNGTPAEDISRVGFKFVDQNKVKKLVGTREIINQDFRIPPGVSDKEVKAQQKLAATF